MNSFKPGPSGVLVVFLPFVGLSAFAAELPAWVGHPPVADRDYVYGVGEARAWGRGRTEQLAQTNALRALAAQVGTEITSETTDVMSTVRSENVLKVATESRTRALIQDAKLVAESVTCRGFWPLRVCNVHALVRWPRPELVREQRRQSRLDAAERLATASGKTEISKLKDTITNALHGDLATTDPDMVQALQDKAEALGAAQKNIDALRQREAVGEAVSYQEASDALAQVRRAQGMDIKEMAEVDRHMRENLAEKDPDFVAWVRSEKEKWDGDQTEATARMTASGVAWTPTKYVYVACANTLDDPGCRVARELEKEDRAARLAAINVSALPGIDPTK